MSSDLNKCFAEPESDCKFHDVIVKVGHHKFLAHKVILAARSKVFGEQFQEDCDEKDCECNCETVVQIKHARPNEVEAFFKLLYTGKLPKSKNLMSKICDLARKYKVSFLEEECEEEKE